MSVNDKWIGGGPCQHPAFLVLEFELVKNKLQPVGAFFPDGKIPKHKKPSLRIVRVLEAVQGRYHCADQIILPRFWVAVVRE